MTSLERRPSFVVLLTGTTGIVVIPAVVISVLATYLIDEFSLTRAQLGFLAAVSSGVAALVSNSFGRLTDHLGGKSSILAVLVVSWLTLFGLAIAPVYPLALAAAFLAGISLAWANPATNKLVAHHVVAGRRGFVTGLKQAGEMAAFAVGGALLPLLAVALGWRWSVFILSLIPPSFLVLALYLLPRDSQVGNPNNKERKRVPLTKDVHWLGVFSIFMGIGGGATTAYLPLLAVETSGFGVRAAGALVLVAAVVAFIFRVLWSRWAEQWKAYRRTLASLAGLASLSAFLLFWSTYQGPALMWLGVFLFGASGLSFASVAMLAAMAGSESMTAGRAAGFVGFGFSVGISIGPPVFGYLVDRTGGYGTSLMGVAIAYGLAASLAVVWNRVATDHF